MTDDWGSDDWAPEEAAPVQEPDATDEVEVPRLYFGSTDEFVRDYLCDVYRRRIDGEPRLWAGAWWMYAEAVIRLEALWRAWESLRLDPSTGMSVWWRDHADHHMPMLMDPNGAFASLDRDDPANRNSKGAPLPYVAPPEGLFPDVRDI